MEGACGPAGGAASESAELSDLLTRCQNSSDDSSDDASASVDDWVVVNTIKSLVEKGNQEKLDAVIRKAPDNGTKQSQLFTAEDVMPDTIQSVPTSRESANSLLNDRAPREVTLAINALVVYRGPKVAGVGSESNHALINGMFGVVVEVDPLKVRFDGHEGPTEIAPCEYRCYWGRKTITRKQVPIVLGWHVVAHSVQGWEGTHHSKKKVCVDFEALSNVRKNHPGWAPNLEIVMLSRAKCLDDLRIRNWYPEYSTVDNDSLNCFKSACESKAKLLEFVRAQEIWTAVLPDNDQQALVKSIQKLFKKRIRV